MEADTGPDLHPVDRSRELIAGISVNQHRPSDTAECVLDRRAPASFLREHVDELCNERQVDHGIQPRDLRHPHPCLVQSPRHHSAAPTERLLLVQQINMATRQRRQLAAYLFLVRLQRNPARTETLYEVHRDRLRFGELLERLRHDKSDGLGARLELQIGRVHAISVLAQPSNLTETLVDRLAAVAALVLTNLDELAFVFGFVEIGLSVCSRGLDVLASVLGHRCIQQ